MTKKSRSTVSIHDVARRAGVSIASVSRAMNEGSGGVSQKTRNAVLRAISELNYSPNHFGRALRAQTTNTFALVLSNIQNNFYGAVAWELERLLSERGLAMLLYNSNESTELQDRCLEDIRGRQVSGVFFLCAVDSVRLREMIGTAPLAFINRRVPALAEVPFIGIDDRAAAGELFESALQRTAGEIAIIHGPLWSDTSARRLDGFLSRAERHGRPIDPGLVLEASLAIESGYECATRLLGRCRPGAIFCGNDQIAYGVFRRCRELGLRVPQDLLIYGFDDNPLNEWLAPWLSTIRVPFRSFAQAALEQMDALGAGGHAREVILPYEVVMRS